jgi:hypothetical protein
MDQPKIVNAEVSRAMAVECQALAARKKPDSASQIMLLHMAETWERIAKTFEADPLASLVTRHNSGRVE